MENAHPLAIKLNTLLKEGKIPEDCMYYKFIDNTTSFAMVDSTSASTFKWDDEVCEFFDTIKFLGGERTRKFVRGPGFHGTGKGGLKQFTTFSDFNLCGPSINASRRYHAGYTTDSGVIKPHLVSLHSFTHQPNAEVARLIETEKLQVIPVAQASDGTALKPGLEFDARQKLIIGLVYKIDSQYVKEHPLPEPEEIKNNLITSADVTYLTSLDNGATMPVAVHYLRKSVKGEEVLTSLENVVKTVQICEMCVKHQECKNNIVTSESSKCSSFCEECFTHKTVCDNCKAKGQVSYIPSLRACDFCLDKKVLCRKLATLAVITDCEECNKKALLELDTMADSASLPPELALVVPLPDVVHVGKSLKCSWSNWFLDLDGELSNLVLLRTLRDNAHMEIRKKLRKLLSLECVRNKDRMAVEPIVRLTRPEVLEVLKQIQFVAHTIVPEKYRFWKSNQTGVCPRPIAITSGPQGTLLVLDYDFESSTAKLVSVRLHQPADVSVKKEGYKDARDICYNNGIAFVPERGGGVISFVDFGGCVTVKVDALKKRADVISYLEKYNLPQDGTVPILRERLRKHLTNVAKKIRHLNHVQLQPALAKPSVICSASQDILLCAD